MALTIIVILAVFLLSILLSGKNAASTSGKETSKVGNIKSRYKNLLANLYKANSDPSIPLTVFLDSSNLYSFGWEGNMMKGTFTMTTNNGFLWIGYEMELNQKLAPHSTALGGMANRKLDWKFAADKDQNEMTRIIAKDLEALYGL